MKIRMTFVMIAAVFAVVSLASAQDFEVRVQAPSILGIFGIGPKTDIRISDETPFYGTVFAMDMDLGPLDPGACLHGRRTFEFDNTEMPVAVKFYSDSERTVYVGYALRTLGIQRGQATLWQIHLGDIRRPDGTYGGWPEAYATPDIGRDREVDFPRIILKSTTAVQFVNITNFTATLTFDNGAPVDIVPGNLRYAEFYADRQPAKNSIVRVVFTDRGRQVGDYRTEIPPSDNPRGMQVVFEPGMIRRY